MSSDLHYRAVQVPLKPVDATTALGFVPQKAGKTAATLPALQATVVPIRPCAPAEPIHCTILPIKHVPSEYVRASPAGAAGIQTKTGTAAKMPVFNVARSSPLHTNLDWSELCWDAYGVTIRGVRYDLHAAKVLPNTTYIRPTLSNDLPMFNTRTNTAVVPGPATA
jgi:hypothetical protein